MHFVGLLSKMYGARLLSHPARAACRLALGLTLSIPVVAASIPTPTLAAQRTPVVFVPGFMGSRLENENGALWGSFLTMFKGMKDLEYKADNGRNPVQATEVLQEFQLFGQLKASGYRAFIKFLKSNEFTENKNLFLFAYDWRKSNLANARRLADFVERRETLRNGRFNLVAHSMGGLLASLYIKQYGGSSKINFFITVATPHLGSTDVLGNMLGHFTNDVTWFLPVIGKDTFLKVFLSFPSLYEQLPVDEGSCLLSVKSGAKSKNCRFFEPSFWANPGLPRDVRRSLPTRLGHYLKNARNIDRPVCRGMPKGIRMFRFAGTGIDTIGQIRLEVGPEYSIRPEFVPGDGVVTEFSASCGDSVETEVFFANHLGILENPTFQYRLRQIITEGRGKRGADVMMLGRKSVTPPRASFAINTPYIRPGGPLNAKLRLRRSKIRPLEGEIVSAFIEPTSSASGSREISVNETRPGVYRITGSSDMAPGVYRLKVNIPGAGELRDYFAVLNQASLPPARKDEEAGKAHFRVLLSSPHGRTPIYRLGDSLDLIVRANRDAWLYCFYRQTKGGLYKIFPNEHQKNAFIPGNRIHAIPGDKHPFEMDFVAPAGTEQARCFATDRDVTRDLPAELRNPAVGPLPDTTAKRLADIFKALPNTKTSEAVLDIEVRP